ncbi:BlaI/MecI/CopY family transcriptional regulator [Pontibacter sp. G13]|uniref:BlaI/MecI/CopY family transcriptional regulator n=1 Tax=Pontibacter sp. G13 TaxID=3074898 RepID=UPI002889CFBF|nr:BlaI/MecI/CopY family transcriptional regulator [Pontibacter sp. G13]WNJ19564.1 BlaI/MecI/CopY family transcriptional regulator [Pontibacter sp. G13]
MEQKLLTPLELKVMNVLWELERGFVKDIIAHWPETPPPAYNTISTIVRILADKKGYVGHEAVGRSHAYFPIVSKPAYQKQLLRNVRDNVFSGSLTGMVSQLLSDEYISSEEIDALRNLIDEGSSE